MALSRLSDEDRRAIFQALRAAADGPFFDGDEFSILFGLGREEFRAVVARIPDVDDADPEVAHAINATLNNLLGYPHGHEGAWAEWVSVPPEELDRVYERWEQLQPPVRYTSLSIHGPVRLGGRFYRVVSYTIAEGGEGMSSQTWKDGRWLGCSGGPGCPQILAAPAASGAELREAGVANEPLPEGYSPLRVPTESDFP